MSQALTADERRAELRLTADAIETQLADLPEFPGMDAPFGEFTIWQRRVDRKVTEILEELGSRGAVFRLSGGDKTLRYLGVRASSTQGGPGLLRNWVNAARRRAEGGP